MSTLSLSQRIFLDTKTSVLCHDILIKNVPSFWNVYENINSFGQVYVCIYLGLVANVCANIDYCKTSKKAKF